MTLFLANYSKVNEIGISNFLKTVFSCYRINKNILNNESNYCLIKNEYIENIFNKIFKDNDYFYEIDNLTNIDVEQVESNFDKTNLIFGLVGWRFFTSSIDNLSIDDYQNEWYLRGNKSAIDFRYTNIPKHIKEEYLEIIKKFNIQDKILNNVEKFKKENNLCDEYLGVHIRTWYNNNNFNDMRTSNERYCYYKTVIQDFINFINNSNLKKVLICTDNIDEISYILKNIDNHKEIILTKKNIELHNLQNDFSDLLLLAGSKFLIGSLNSTFTELAWWYGGCSDNIKIF